MKRLNPKTGKPFRRGDVREDGYVFKQFQKLKNKNGFFYEEWTDLESYVFRKSFSNAMSRARRDKLPFNLTKDYLKSIKTDNCPVFGFPLSWSKIGEGSKNNNRSPSLDRIVPEYGYIIGNVVYISNLANQIKSSATEIELYAVADWLHDERKRVLRYVEQISTTPIPARPYRKSKNNPQLGIIPTTGAWQDGDNIDDHSGTVQGQDVDHCAQENSRDCVVSRSKEVEPFVTPTSIQDNGDSSIEIVRLDFSSRYLSDKP